LQSAKTHGYFPGLFLAVGTHVGIPFDNLIHSHEVS
jgi:hypothetical protein